jgi:HD-GYP domain-containing protein (c-di-GMP phosphodiesterase class II)
MENKAYLLLDDVLHSIESIIATIDPYTAGHQKRVTDLALAIANELNLTEDTIEGIRISASLHDIGKMGIPIQILCKPGRLRQEEFNLMMKVPEIGYHILKQFNFSWPVADIVLQHYEKCDGSGYPHGLTGDKILIQAKILCVANVVEAIASHRPYRIALGIDAALDEISKNSSQLYDSTVVNACLKIFKEKNYTLKNA